MPAGRPGGQPDRSTSVHRINLLIPKRVSEKCTETHEKTRQIPNTSPGRVAVILVPVGGPERSRVIYPEQVVPLPLRGRPDTNGNFHFRHNYPTVSLPLLRWSVRARITPDSIPSRASSRLSLDRVHIYHISERLLSLSPVRYSECPG